MTILLFQRNQFVPSIYQAIIDVGCSAFPEAAGMRRARKRDKTNRNVRLVPKRYATENCDRRCSVRRWWVAGDNGRFVIADILCIWGSRRDKANHGCQTFRVVVELKNWYLKGEQVVDLSMFESQLKLVLIKLLDTGQLQWKGNNWKTKVIKNIGEKKKNDKFRWTGIKTKSGIRP